MAAGALYRWFVRKFRIELVQDAYRGILGREADPSGLAAHAEALRAAASLAPMLADMAVSKEAMNRYAPSPSSLDYEPIVVAAFRGLLRRDPEPEALAAYAKLLEETGDVGAFLSEVGGSEERRNVMREQLGGMDSGSAPSANRDETVTAVFRGLLGRDPEPEAMAAYGALLAESGDVARLIAEVAQSEEHRRRVLLRRL